MGGIFSTWASPGTWRATCTKMYRQTSARRADGWFYRKDSAWLTFTCVSPACPDVVSTTQGPISTRIRDNFPAQSCTLLLSDMDAPNLRPVRGSDRGPLARSPVRADRASSSQSRQINAKSNPLTLPLDRPADLYFVQVSEPLELIHPRN